MAKSVETKDHLQCRSHHQKMVKKLQTTENIIKFLMEEVCGVSPKKDNGSESQKKTLADEQTQCKEEIESICCEKETKDEEIFEE